MTSEFFGPLPPSDFNQDAMVRWLDQQVVSFQKIITGSLQANNVLSSSNYVAGVSGWMIDGDGNAEFNDVEVRGDIISGNWDGADPANLAIYDSDATEGFYLDSSAGAAQFMGPVRFGGESNARFEFKKVGTQPRLEVYTSTELAGIFGTFGSAAWLSGPASALLLEGDQNAFIDLQDSKITFLTSESAVVRATISDTNLSLTVPVLLNDGSAAAPALAFTSDTNTGIYRSGSDELSFSVGGSMKLQLAAGRVDINDALRILDGSAANPAIRFSSDTNTGIYRAGTDSFAVSSGGNTNLIVANSGVHVGFGGTHTSGGSGLFVWDLLTDIGNHEVLRANRGAGTGTTEVGYFSSWEYDPHTGERRKDDIVSLAESPRWNRDWFYKIRPIDFRRLSTGEREFGFLLDEWKATADDMKYLTTKGDQWGGGPHETAVLAATILEVQDHEARLAALEQRLAA